MYIHTAIIDTPTITDFQPIVDLDAGVSIVANEPFNPAALDMLRRVGKEEFLLQMIDIFYISSQERIAAAHTAAKAQAIPTCDKELT
jgi:hypothetical protein